MHSRKLGFGFAVSMRADMPCGTLPAYVLMLMNMALRRCQFEEEVAVRHLRRMA